jgi:uncharacterized membrane protein YcjF (UPF0283 family)
MLAYTYPILSIFWSMLIFFGFCIWIWLLFTCFADLFRSDDISGWGKAGWTILLLFVPLLGVLLYLIVRGGGMQARAERRAAADQAQFDDYVRKTSASASSAQANGQSGVATADALERLATLRDEGTITPEEFQQEKTKILAS